MDRWFPAGVASLAQRYVSLGSGEQVRVVEGGPEGAPAVVFIHGWACSVYTFHRNLSAIATSGYRVIAFDIRGHGLSYRPRDPDAYTVHALRRHVLDVLDAVGVARASLVVGHSLGGAIAADLATHEPARVERLALLAPVGFGVTWPIPIGRIMTPRLVTPLLGSLFSRPVVTLTLRVASGGLRIPRGTDVDQYWAPLQFPETGEVLRNIVHHYDWGLWSRDRLDRLAVPTVVLAGGRDRLIGWGRVRGLVEAMPTARVRFVPAAGHVIAEEAPEEVNSELVALLEGERRSAPDGRSAGT